MPTNPFYPIYLKNERRSRFYQNEPDFEPITRTHQYEDGAMSFNELGDVPQEAWEIVYSGLTREQAKVIDDHFRDVRTSRPFEFFDDKTGLLYSDCYYKSCKPDHDGHMSWSQERIIQIVRYPSDIEPVLIDVIPPTTPTSLTTSSITSTGFTANWTASTDNVTAQNQITYEIEIDLVIE